MKLTLLTAASRAAALPDFVATANPDGKLKYTEMGTPNVSARGFCRKCTVPKGRSTRSRRDHKKGSCFTIMLYLLFYLYPQLAIFPNYEWRLSGARPLKAFAFPCPTVRVHQALHPKS